MTITIFGGRTFHIHFVHSSHLDDDPMSPEFGKPKTRKEAGAIRRALDYDAEITGRRLTLCSVSEVTQGGDSYSGYQMLGQGVSICHSNDTFRKPVGRKLSLAAALKASGLSYDERTEVWNAYRAEMPDK